MPRPAPQEQAAVVRRIQRKTQRLSRHRRGNCAVQRDGGGGAGTRGQGTRLQCVVSAQHEHPLQPLPVLTHGQGRALQHRGQHAVTHVRVRGVVPRSGICIEDTSVRRNRLLGATRGRRLTPHIRAVASAPACEAKQQQEEDGAPNCSRLKRLRPGQPLSRPDSPPSALRGSCGARLDGPPLESLQAGNWRLVQVLTAMGKHLFTGGCGPSSPLGSLWLRVSLNSCVQFCCRRVSGDRRARASAPAFSCRAGGCCPCEPRAGPCPPVLQCQHAQPAYCGAWVRPRGEHGRHSALTRRGTLLPWHHIASLAASHVTRAMCLHGAQYCQPSLDGVSPVETRTTRGVSCDVSGLHAAQAQAASTHHLTLCLAPR